MTTNAHGWVTYMTLTSGKLYTNLEQIKNQKRPHLSKKSIYLLIKSEMVFCFQNCSDLLREKMFYWLRNLLKFEAEDQREFVKKLRSQEQFVEQWKVRTIFGNRMLF